MDCGVVIVAAGRGERAGGERPKQYARLADVPVLRRSLRPFASLFGFDALQVVIDPDHRSLYDEAVGDLPLPPPVGGGTTRQASVRAGLEALLPRAPRRVLVHDAARPFVSRALVRRVVNGLDEAPAVVPAVAVVDSLLRAEGARVRQYVRREGIARVQTPQGFDFAALLGAHRASRELSYSDDASLALAAGIPVSVVAGEEDNMKLTTPDDFARAERLLAATRSWRTGFGYDVHRFAAGRPLYLAGVAIPAERGLAGHSDADVGLHALTDALLATIGAGDIGSHFPASDPRWKDASSDRFLLYARELLEAAGGRLEHCDLTLVCERPKIGPFREQMRGRVAELLRLPQERVSIKATTTEGLGFAGRGEGIAAHAVATASFARGAEDDDP